MTATLTLLRFNLRRDRLMLVCWIVGGVVLYVSQAVSTDGLYSSQAELDKAAASMESNAAFIAMAGPARALDTIGGQVAWQAAAFGAIVAGLMSMFIVGRHTRVEEESGRDELLRAGVVGRHAPLAAAAAVMGLANLALAGLIAASLASYGLPVQGSLALGVACGLAGLVFGAVTMATVQLAQSSRAAYGMTGAVLGIAYVLRAIGDIGNGALSWLSPIGWGQYMRAYAGESWWPALLSIATATGLAMLSVVLFDRRDLGAGLWAARPGPARGGLSSSAGLAWRLQRWSIVGWATGLLLSGLAFGSIGDEVGDLVGDSSFSNDLFARGGSIVDSFYATLAAMLGLLATGFAVSSVLRLRGEEADHYAELLLSTGLSRRRWVWSHLAVTMVGSAMIVVAGGTGLALGFGPVTGDDGSAVAFGWSVFSYVSPVLVLAALTAFAWASRPAWGAIGWLAIGYCSVVLLFGASLQLPRWLTDISPFETLALVPAESFSAVAWLTQLAVAMALFTGASVMVNRRDLQH